MPSVRQAALCILAAVPSIGASCVIPSAAEPSAPSPGLAVCASYRDSACCTLDTELEFMATIAQASYTQSACRAKMMDLHCATSCHPNQTAFVVGSTVRICSSFCDALHGACGDGGDAATWCEAAQYQWLSLGYNTTIVADGDAAGSCWGANDGCDGVPNSGLTLDRCGVCGGNATCVVPGAARAAEIRAVLGSELATHNADSALQMVELSNFATALEARLASEQSRAAASWNASSGRMDSERSANDATFAAKSDYASISAAVVEDALDMAKVLSENTLDVLGAGARAHNMDYNPI